MKRKVANLILITALTAMALLMTGCAPKADDTVFETYGKGALKILGEELPDSVEVYHEEVGLGYCFYMDGEDNETAAALTDAFKGLTISKEVSPDSVEGIFYEITFDFADKGAVTVSFNGSYLSYYDPARKSFNVYEIAGADILQELITEALYSEFGYPTSYETILEAENILLELGEYYEDEDGDFIVEIKGTNTSKQDVCFKMNATVNGYPIYSYQTLGLMAESNDSGFYIPIPTSMLKAYGIENIGEVVLTVDVFEYENRSEGQRIVSTDEPIVIQTDSYGEADKSLKTGTPLYEKDDVAIYGRRDEADTYTGMMLYYVNGSEKDRAFYFNSIKADKSDIDVENYNSIMNIAVSAGSSMFVYVPLSNYTWDEKTGITEKTEIKTLKVSFDINDGKKITTTKQAVVK